MTENRPALVYELNLGNWTDISQYVAMGDSDTVVIGRGRPDEGQSAQASTCTLMLNNRDGRFSPRNPVGAYYGLIGRNTPLRVRTPDAPSVLHLAAQGDDASTPDSIPLDITGAIDVRASLKLDRLDGTMCILSKGNVVGNTGADLSYQFLIGVNADGVPHITFRYSSDGTTIHAADHDLPSLSVGQRVGVRVTFDPATGGNHTYTFYVSNDGTLGGTWIQDGAAIVAAGATSIHAGVAPLVIGRNGLADELFGDVYGVEVRNGIGGTVVAKPDFTAVAPGTTSFTDAAGRTQTLHQGAQVVTSDDGNRFTGEVSAWPQQGENTGADVWTQVSAGGILRRLGQGQAAQQTGLETFIGSNPFGFDQCWPGDTQYSLSGARTKLVLSNCSRNVKFGQGDMGDGYPVGMLIQTTNPGTGPFAPTTGFVRADVLAGPGGTFEAIGFVFKASTLGNLTLYTQGFGSLFPGGYGLFFDVNTASVILKRSLTDPDTGTTTTVMDSEPLGTVFSDGQIHSVLWTIVDSGASLTHTVYIDGVAALTSVEGIFSALQGITYLWLTYDPTVGNGSDVAVSYLTVWSNHATAQTMPDPTTWALAANGYVGEAAGIRIKRLCAENDIPFAWVGDLTDTIPMGPQGTGDLITLLQDAANVDQGILYEPRDRIGLAYRTRASLYNQSPRATFDYSAGQLGEAPLITDDDQTLRNDVTANRPGGASARDTLDDGPLSTQPPPDGVGTYATQVSVNAASDGLLQDQASWRVALGTVDEARYPALTVSLMNPAVASTALLGQVLDTDVGDAWRITELPAGQPPEDVTQLVQGYSETITGNSWVVKANASPASPYSVAVYGTDRYDAEDSSVNIGFNTAVTSLSIASAPHTQPWTTDPAAFPFDINIGGERMTVTNITGASSPQTFTVIRHVNGIVKSHVAGEKVTLWNRPRYAL